MTSLFFYGTLRHLPLLALVLGRGAERIDHAPATLDGHAVLWARDQAFPLLTAEDGSTAHGLVVRDLSAADLDRLNFYEGSFGYTLREVMVATGQGREAAQVYFPDPGLWEHGAAWDLDDWRAEWEGITMRAAAEVMGRFGRVSPDEIAPLFPFIRARAWAQELAQDAAPTALRHEMQPGDVEFLQHMQGHDGFFRLARFTLRHRRFDGTWSGEIGREAFVAFDAALVLPYDPVTDRVLLIEQLRYGPLMRGDPAPWVLEPVAGLVDAGEDPAETARREAVEEANLALREIRPMFKVYPSPGYTTEFFHCFLGLCDLGGHDGGLGGLDSENEDIRTHVLDFAQVMDLVDSGEINAGPLVTMILWLARARDGLRAAA